MLPQQPAENRRSFIGIIASVPSFAKQHGRSGMLMRSVYPSRAGAPINPLGSYLLDHRTKFEERWGGWYVIRRCRLDAALGESSVVSDPTKPESTHAIEGTASKSKATSWR